MSKKDEIDKLKNILKDTHDFPCVYLYKFILKGDLKKIALVESLFDDSAVISTQESSKGTYVSISVREMTMDASEVLRKYDEARAIDGVMVL